MYYLLFTFGLIVGSFLNVATLRYRPEGRLFALRDLRGRSRCPVCSATLRWFELIPFFSYLALRGRCRSCRARISIQYPLVELVSGLLVCAVPLSLNRFWGVSDQAFFSLAAPPLHYLLVFCWVLVAALLLALVVVDIRHFLIPNGLSLALALLGAGIGVVTLLHRDALPAFRDSFLGHYALLVSVPGGFLANRVFGALVGGCLFWAIHAVSRGRAMGFGDVKLAAALGLALGWPDIGVAVALSFMVGGLLGAALIALGKRTMRDLVPFGPFLVAGTLATVLAGSSILEWYFSLFRA